MTPWIVVPLGRRDSVPRVLANIRRQAVRARVCIAENGAGLGACERYGFTPDVLVTTENHQAVAKNEAVAEVRRRGGGLVAFWDDDDYYGPAFLAEALANVGRANVIGKLVHFVRLSDATLYLFHPDTAAGKSTWLHGPTTLVQAEDALEFPRASNDDTGWCAAMAKAGATFLNTGPWRYLYDRHRPGPRVWDVCDELVRLQLGAVLRFGELPDSFVDVARSMTELTSTGEGVPAPGNDEIFGWLRREL